MKDFSQKLELDFFRRPDVEQIAQDLLGHVLFTHFDGKLTGGLIVETEAYEGRNDRASHAFNGRRTKRTEVFFENGGVSYVYLCYGMHHLFNVVTNRKGEPDAVLIRAIEPLVGVDWMLKRRGMEKPQFRLTNGPGSVARALGITSAHNAISLSGDEIWISREKSMSSFEIKASPRVGVGYAGADALLPRRYRVLGNPWTGK